MINIKIALVSYQSIMIYNQNNKARIKIKNSKKTGLGLLTLVLKKVAMEVMFGGFVDWGRRLGVLGHRAVVRSSLAGRKTPQNSSHSREGGWLVRERVGGSGCVCFGWLE